MSLSFKNKVFYKGIQGIRLLNISRFYKIKDDNRETANFKLLYFCGRNGIEYLNASLISVYKNWGKLPELVIVTDGTPKEFFKEKLIKWPRKVNILSWEECALSFKDEGNINLYNYAANKLYGKKYAGILYCAKRFPVLYSDSDILWFNYPTEFDAKAELKNQIIMSEDIDYFYENNIFKTLNEEHCLENKPLNAGVIYLNGQFSSFPKWKELCEFLGKNEGLGHFTEQTCLAILNNYFNPHTYLTNKRVLIKIDDAFSTKYTLKDNPAILARHYVSVKDTTFWRDFFIMTIKNLFKKNGNTGK